MYTRKYPPLVTNTWIFIGFLNDLKPGTKKPVRILGRDLILWRTHSGKPSLINAYCSHMGVHLGSANIHGEVLECAFHKRCFDTQGKCIGKGKDNDAYPIKCIDNSMFAWFGQPVPLWDMPDFLSGFPNKPDSKWKIAKWKSVVFNFHPQDLLDNSVDPIHYKVFHKQCISFEPAEIIEKSPFRFISKLKFHENPLFKKFKIPFELDMIVETHGPCNLIANVTAKIKSNIYYYFKFIFYCAPIENGKTKFTLITSIMDQKGASLKNKILYFLYSQFAFYKHYSEFCRESKVIWEGKTYPQKPDFTQQELVINHYHDWYSQFYVSG